MLPPSSEPNRRTINQNTFIHLDKATIQGQESAVSLLFWLRGGAVVSLRALTVNPGDVLQYREPLDSDVSINQTHTDHSSTLAHAKWRASGDHVHTNTHKTQKTQDTNTSYKHKIQTHASIWDLTLLLLRCVAYERGRHDALWETRGGWEWVPTAGGILIKRLHLLINTPVRATPQAPLLLFRLPLLPGSFVAVCKK